MNLIELTRALRQLRLGGIVAVLETRLHQAQVEPMAPIDFISCLVADELTRRSERLLERRRKQAQFRDSQKTLDNFDSESGRDLAESELLGGLFLLVGEKTLEEFGAFLFIALYANQRTMPPALEVKTAWPHDCSYFR